MFYFFNDTATTEIYTLSLHDALPILAGFHTEYSGFRWAVYMLSEYANIFVVASVAVTLFWGGDRKSTRLNSSHANISYAVFCLKKKLIHKFINQNILYLYYLSIVYFW